MRNRLLALSLLFALVAPLVATFGYLEFQKLQVKNNMVRKLKDNQVRDIVLMKFVAGEQAKLNWKHDKEFELNGTMYDVDRKIQLGEELWVWCHKDTKETRINKAIAALHGSWLGQATDNQQQVPGYVQLLKMTYFPISNHLRSLTLGTSELLCASYSFSTKEFITIPDAPPPQLG